MDSIFFFIILSIIQGILEIFPVSSSLHLYFIPIIFDLPKQGLHFSIITHASSILSIIIYYKNIILLIVRNTFNFFKFKKTDYYFELGIQIITINIPICIVGYFFYDKILFLKQSKKFIVFFIFLFSIMMYASQKTNVMHSKIIISKNIFFLYSFLQIFALIPGVSRLGITTTIGLFCGFSYKDSICFSFLLATPLILFAIFFEMYNIVTNGYIFFFKNLCITACISLFFSFVSIRFLLPFVKYFSFTPFVIYRCFFAILLFFI